MTGKHIENIPFHFKQLAKPQFFVENDIITVVQIPVMNKETFLFQQDMKGELIQTISPTEEMDAQSFDGEIFTSRNNNVYAIHYTALDTLYNYDAKTNSLVPRFHVVFNTDDWFASYCEWPNHFVTFAQKCFLVDKHTGKAHFFKAKNDFLGGIDVGYIACDNNYLVVVCEVFQLRSDLEKNVNKNNLTQDVRARMTELLNSIDEDDNPVLVIGKLKE